MQSQRAHYDQFLTTRMTDCSQFGNVTEIIFGVDLQLVIESVVGKTNEVHSGGYSDELSKHVKLG